MHNVVVVNYHLCIFMISFSFSFILMMLYVHNKLSIKITIFGYNLSYVIIFGIEWNVSKSQRGN